MTTDEKIKILIASRKAMKPLKFGYITKQGKVSQGRLVEVVEVELGNLDPKMWGRDLNDKRALKRFDIEGIQNPYT